MKLLTFKKEDNLVLGINTDKGIVDVETALTAYPVDNVPTDVMQVISEGQKGLHTLQKYIVNLLKKKDTSFLLNENEVEWGPCVTRPNKIICVGLNYKKHADETNATYPDVPILFNKFNNTLTGHQANVTIPKQTEKLDYEVELGVVIGKESKNINEEDALDHIFGYCTANDLSARDLQFKTAQWLLGKTCDDFSPIGPYLVSADEVEDPNQLQLKTIVNGEVRQNSSTSDMIFNVPEIVSYISKHMTLTPGDIILTGTPEGGKPKP